MPSGTTTGSMSGRGSTSLATGVKSSGSFTATGTSSEYKARDNALSAWAVTGTFVATTYLERSKDGGTTWEILQTITAAASGRVNTGVNEKFRFRCSDYTSGTVSYSFTNLTSQIQRVIPANGKAGTTAGWVVNAGDNIFLATLPESQTGSTLIIPITGLEIGMKIKGFSLIGQMESGGHNVGVAADLRKLTAAAADMVDSSVATLSAVTGTADTALTDANTLSDNFEEVVDSNATYYMKLTATTGVATDIGIAGVVIYLDAE